MTELLTVESQAEGLLDLQMLDGSRPTRKESFVDLMEDRYAGFLEYEAVEMLGSDLLMTQEAEPGNSDVESTSSSLKEELELPQVLRKRTKKDRHAVVPKYIPAILLPQPPKQIGLISIEERRAKIERFMAKRARRCWSRKICYDCRKRVADSRLRVKGRFVSKVHLETETKELREERVEIGTEDEGCDMLRGE